MFPIEECPVGTQRFVSIQGVELAVFHLPRPDGFVAIRNSCPHAGGNLSAGRVANAVVTCPWHEWEFDLRTGACVHNAMVRVQRFPARVEKDWLEVDLSGAGTTVSMQV